MSRKMVEQLLGKALGVDRRAEVSIAEAELFHRLQAWLHPLFRTVVPSRPRPRRRLPPREALDAELGIEAPVAVIRQPLVRLRWLGQQRE